MKDSLYINGKDSYTTWGITFDSSAISALMTPPPAKENVKSSSRQAHGATVLTTSPKWDSRDVTVAFNIEAPTETVFFSRYQSFCDELAKGFLNIRTRYQTGVVYRMEYRSCSQFSEYSRTLAKFTLKLTENDPSNREMTEGATDE